ncbi:LCP family protein [Streptomyces sp. NPDC059740]|uniref:LCP family protein n=1 Tax=Streptomyces sp. NPDC059740 TaxID=3346926 RepID=UPI00364E6886
MWATTGLSALVLAAGGTGHAVVAGVSDQIARVDAFQGMSDRPPADDRARSGMTILLVGTDGRGRLSRRDRRAYHLGGEPCHCTDTIMLVRLSPGRDHVSVVSLPRDSYAQVPEHTDPATGKRHRAHPLKLNAAYAEGGPSLTVRTVEHMTGVHIDHYLEVDFQSFMRTVDAVGGVRICTDRAMKDSYTGLDLPAGMHELTGGQALQYVRSRHVDGAADLSRMRRQQRFMAALIRKVTSSGVLTDPTRLRDVTGSLLGSVRADKGFGTDDMLDLGRAMHGFQPGSSEFASVPVADVNYRVPYVGLTVKWDEERARALFQAVREDRPLVPRTGPAGDGAAPKGSATSPAPASTPAAGAPGPAGRGPRPTTVEIPPDQVRVHVDNGTSRSGLGARVADGLRATGFTLDGPPGTAPLPHSAHTVVRYDPRWDRSVRSVAAAFPGARLQAVPGLGAAIRVTVGQDFTAVHPVRGNQPAPGHAQAVTGDQVSCS